MTRPLSPQQQLILDYLKEDRTLTSQIAMINLGIYSLSRRITELIRLGYPIQTGWGTDHFGRRYKTYQLPKEGEEMTQTVNDISYRLWCEYDIVPWDTFETEEDAKEYCRTDPAIHDWLKQEDATLDELWGDLIGVEAFEPIAK